MADIQEVLVDGLVGETTQFLGELKKKRDEAVKNQVLMEIEWLKSVQVGFSCFVYFIVSFLFVVVL